MEGDTPAKIQARIARSERGVKDARRVELYQWEDPVLGCRKIPSLDNPMEGLIPVLQDMKFSIDTTENVVRCGGSVCPTLVYKVLTS